MISVNHPEMSVEDIEKMINMVLRSLMYHQIHVYKKSEVGNFWEFFSKEYLPVYVAIKLYFFVLFTLRCLTVQSCKFKLEMSFFKTCSVHHYAKMYMTCIVIY